MNRFHGEDPENPAKDELINNRRPYRLNNFHVARMLQEMENDPFQAAGRLPEKLNLPLYPKSARRNLSNVCKNFVDDI